MAADAICSTGVALISAPAPRAVGRDPAPEIAAGTGAVTTVLAAELPDTRITATDLNEPSAWRRRNRTAGNANVSWRQADALSLPFGDASFDIVACQFGAMFFPDQSRLRRSAACDQAGRTLLLQRLGQDRGERLRRRDAADQHQVIRITCRNSWRGHRTATTTRSASAAT